MTENEFCKQHERYKPCPVCQLPKVAIPGSSVISGSFKSVEELKEHYGIDDGDTCDCDDGVECAKNCPSKPFEPLTDDDVGD